MGHDMRRDWIIDVLADLKAFAEHNGMDATAAGLEDAALVAVAEISSLARHCMVAEADPIPVEYDRETGNVTDLFSHRGQV
ncbi:MAG TPA: hypothetical protein DIU07_06630 [Rhodobacteraceae bacterium]|nr:hypothetical protein [Paracoccaceae bacterium]